MDYPMRSDLRAGNKFPDFELPDHTGELRKLSQLLKGFPGVLTFSRGYFCPQDRRQLTNYVIHLQRMVVCGPAYGGGNPHGFTGFDEQARRLGISGERQS